MDENISTQQSFPDEERQLEDVILGSKIVYDEDIRSLVVLEVVEYTRMLTGWML